MAAWETEEASFQPLPRGNPLISETIPAFSHFPPFLFAVLPNCDIIILGLFALSMVSEAFSKAGDGLSSDKSTARRRRVLHILLWLVIDAVLVNGSLVLSQILRYMNHISYSFFWISFRLAPVMTVLFLLCFGLSGLYRTIWRYASTGDLLRIVVATFAATVLTYLFSLIAGYITAPRNLFLMHRLVYLLLWIISTLVMVASRLLYHFISDKTRSSRASEGKPRRVMIVGGGRAGAHLVHDIQSGAMGNYTAAVIVDDDAERVGSYLSGVPVERGSSSILHLASSYGVDEIIIAIATPRGNLTPVINKCISTGCRVRMLNPLREVHGSETVSQTRDVSIADLLEREEENLISSEGAEFYQGKTVLITGGGGSIGSELCRRLIPFGPEKIVLLDVNENDMYDLQSELRLTYGGDITSKLALCVGSVRDETRVNEVFGLYHPQIVLHAAAHKHVPLMEDCPAQAVRNNVYGTRVVAEAALHHKAECFLLISTDKAVNPTSVMGATKRLAEMLMEDMSRARDTVFCAVRFGNVLGSHGSVVPLFERQIRAGGPVTLTHPDIIRYFMTIPEAAGLVLRAASMAKGGEIFVLDMGKPVRIQDLAEKMIRLYTRPGEKPAEIVYTGLRPGEKLYEELLLTEEGNDATPEKKIFIAHPDADALPSSEEIFSVLDEALSQGGEDAALQAIHQLVRNFRSPGVAAS